MNLSEDQQKELQQKYIAFAQSVMEFQEVIMKAFVPVIEATSAFYAAVPEELKEAIAKNQVEEIMKKKGVSTVSPEEKFIADKLMEYQQYWDEEKQIYNIDDGAWTPTRLELIADLEKSWKFENEH
jgi:hypothetical protein